MSCARGATRSSVTAAPSIVRQLHFASKSAPSARELRRSAIHRRISNTPAINTSNQSAMSRRFWAPPASCKKKSERDDSQIKKQNRSKADCKNPASPRWGAHTLKLGFVLFWHVASRCLTVKLRGRPWEPDQSRGRIISSRARGDTTMPHGTLQRVLDRPRNDIKQFPRFESAASHRLR